MNARHHHIAGLRIGVPSSRRFKGGGGGTNTTTTVQNNDPWTGQQDYLKYGFQQAQDIYNSNKPEYYQGNTVAGFNPTQTLAQNLGVNRALTGSPVQQAGQQQATSTLNGDYLTPGNPYMTNLTQAINAQVQPLVDSRFAGSNRFGSTGHEAAYTSALANAIAPQAFNSYEAERGRQAGLATQAPALAAADYNDINALGQVGQQQQGQSQADINAAIDKFNFEQNLPQNKLANFMQMVQGNYGGTNTATQTGPAPGKGGSTGNLLGGAGNLLGGAGTLYGAFG